MALDRIGVPPVRNRLDALLRGDESLSTGELIWLGTKAPGELRTALMDKRFPVRCSAARALAYADPPEAAAIPVLLEALNHEDREDRVFGVIPALARFGPKAKAALPSLIGLAREHLALEGVDPDVFVALVLLDPDGEECLPVLIAGLKHKEPETAIVAAECLGMLGPKARNTAPALIAVTTHRFDKLGFDGEKEKDWEPHVAAIKALLRSGAAAPSAIPAIIDILKEFPDSEAAAAAARALGSFGAEAKDAVPILMAEAQRIEEENTNWQTRKAAILALGQIGPAAKPAVPTLRKIVEQKGGRESVYHGAAYIALSRLTPDGKALAEKWLATEASYPRQWHSDHRMDDRAKVMAALGQTSVEADWLTRRCLEMNGLNTISFQEVDYDSIRYFEWIFQELGDLGVGARLAVPRLKELGKAPHPWIRMWAHEALERIEPGLAR